MVSRWVDNNSISSNVYFGLVAWFVGSFVRICGVIWCLLFSVVPLLSWGVSFLVSCVFGCLSASGGVGDFFVEFIVCEWVCVRNELHERGVITRAKEFPVHCEGSVFDSLVDWYGIDFVG